MKVSELSGALLDYWVARAEEIPLSSEWDCCVTGGIFIGLGVDGDLHREFWPSERWADGGPIIVREFIATYGDEDGWCALVRPYVSPGGDMWAGITETGPTLLIAAMRARVASKFGDEVEDANRGH